jgi:ABC-type glycerol-3-phosphate transport system substrate-binding protein
MLTRRIARPWAAVAAAAALAVVASVAACGSPNGASGSGGSGGSGVTLTFATNQITGENTGTTPAFKNLVSEFEKQNPGVHVQLEEAQNTALQPLIQLAFSSHNVPDVFNFWRPQPAFNMNNYIASGELGNLTSLARTPAVKSEFPASSWQTATVNGQVWGLPLTNYAVPLLVNKAVFAKAGLPLPTTWQRLVTDVPALKAKGYIPWTVSTEAADQSDDRLLDYVLDRELGNQAALQLFEGKSSFTSAPAEKALSEYLSISAGYGPPDASSLDDYSAISKYYDTGRSAMILTNSAYTSEVSGPAAQTTEVIPFPVIPGGAQTTAHIEKDLTTLMYASTAALADPAKAPLVKKFLTLATSLPQEQLLSDNGVLPAAPAVKTDPAKSGQVFASIERITAAEPEDRWLGDARTPSQQQSFYPLMSQTWSGSLTASSLGSQLQSMFQQ